MRKFLRTDNSNEEEDGDGTKRERQKMLFEGTSQCSQALLIACKVKAAKSFFLRVFASRINRRTLDTSTTPALATESFEKDATYFLSRPYTEKSKTQLRFELVERRTGVALGAHFARQSVSIVAPLQPCHRVEIVLIS